MTGKARKKPLVRMKQAFRQSVQARKSLQRAVSAYKKLVNKYRAA